HSLTRFAPLAMTRIGRPLVWARNTSDLAICPTSQPSRLAASAEVRVLSANSRTSPDSPRARRASWTFRTLALSAVVPGCSLLVESGVSRSDTPATSALGQSQVGAIVIFVTVAEQVE